MTSRFRLFLACLICALALPAGLAASNVSQGGGVGGGGRAWNATALAGSEDIDAYVRRVAEAGLLPDAVLRPGEGEAGGGADTVGALEAAFRDPELAAIVREGEDWRIYIYGLEGAVDRLRVGDRLSDGWTIEEIRPVRVTVSNGETSHRIEVFQSVEPEN